MTPATIVQRIIDLGLNESAPDTNLQAKALGWLNSAYQEAYGEAAKYALPILKQTVNVTITNGAGTLAAPYRRIYNIVDTVTKRVLKPSDIGYVRSIDPMLERTGDPARYYFDGSETSIKTHPKNSTTVQLDVMPKAAELVIGDTEDAIKIPSEFHEMLVWASLVEGMTYERGFGNNELLQVANIRKTQLMDNYSRWLKESVPQQVQRTKYQDF